MKQYRFLPIFTLAFALLGAVLVHAQPSMESAIPTPDNYINNYEPMDLDFLRTHYTEIHNGRPLQFVATFSSYKWLSPFEYKERLKLAGLNVEQFNILQFTLKELDDFHYSFPICLFEVKSGDLTELGNLKEGERVRFYGVFYNLRKSEYAFKTDLIETIQEGGHDREVLLDARQPETATPTATITATPGPNIFQRIDRFVNPKETATPSVSETPNP